MVTILSQFLSLSFFWITLFYISFLVLTSIWPQVDNVCVPCFSTHKALSPHASQFPPGRRKLPSSLLLQELAQNSLLAQTTLYWNYLWMGQFSQLTVGSLRARLLFYSLMNLWQLEWSIFSKYWIIKNMLRTHGKAHAFMSLTDSNTGFIPDYGELGEVQTNPNSAARMQTEVCLTPKPLPCFWTAPPLYPQRQPPLPTTHAKSSRRGLGLFLRGYRTGGPICNHIPHISGTVKGKKKDTTMWEPS